MDSIRNLIKEVGLVHLQKKLLELALPSIRLHPRLAANLNLSIGTSRLGGFPDLPLNLSWPKWNDIPLSFIAQFNLEELTAYDVQKLLPSTGILYFFLLDVQDDLDLDKYPFWNYAQVLHYTGDLTQLSRVETPTDLAGITIYPPCTFTFSSEYTLPPPESEFIQGLNLSEQEQEIYWDRLWLELRPDGEAYHRMLGFPDPINDYGMPYQSERLLLQVDSDEAINLAQSATSGMLWGDQGMIYFMITEEDLQQGNFSAVRSEYQGC